MVVKMHKKSDVFNVLAVLKKPHVKPSEIPNFYPHFIHAIFFHMPDSALSIILNFSPMLFTFLVDKSTSYIFLTRLNSGYQTENLST